MIVLRVVKNLFNFLFVPFLDLNAEFFYSVCLKISIKIICLLAMNNQLSLFSKIFMTLIINLVDRKIIRALEIIRAKNLIPSAVLRNKYLSSHDL